MFKLSSLIMSALALMTLPTCLPAIPLTWTFSGVTLSDGASLTGSFVFDADTGIFSDINVNTTGGTQTPSHYIALNTSPDRKSISFGFHFVTAAQGDLTNTGSLDSFFSPPMSNNGGSILFTMSENTCTNAGCSTSIGGRYTHTALITATPPIQVTSISPINQNGFSRTFTATFTDFLGASDLSDMDLLFNSTLNGTGACWIHYSTTSNKIFLYNDGGSGVVPGFVTPGGPGMASNAQCTIASGGPVTTGSNTAALPVSVSFNTINFQDTKSVFGRGKGFTGGDSGWTLKGTWTTIAPQPPMVLSVSPINGTGTSKTFTAVFSDPAGSGDLSKMSILFGSDISGVSACWVIFDRSANMMFLEDNAGNGSAAGSVTPGGSGTASNSQCSISSGGSVTISGNSVAIPVAVTFTGAFAGPRNVFGRAVGYDSLDSGWQILGSWNTSSSSGPPSVISASPVNGTGSSRIFTGVFYAPAGTGDLSAVRLLFNVSANNTGGCSLIYVPASNAIFLENDLGTGNVANFVTPGGAGVASNSQCTISSGGPVTTFGDILYLPVSISFNTSTFAGVKNVYGQATGGGGTTNFVLLGTWQPL